MTAQSASHASPAFVDLPGLLASVSDHAVLADPALGALMVEYACGEMYLAEWHGRQPRRRHDGYDGWIFEGRALFDRRDELKTMAYTLLRRGGEFPRCGPGRSGPPI